MKERQNDVWVACHWRWRAGFPAAGASPCSCSKFRRPKSELDGPGTRRSRTTTTAEAIADALRAGVNDDARSLAVLRGSAVDEEPYVVWVKRLPGMVDRAKDAFRQLRAASSLVLDVFEHETKRGMGF